MFEARKNLNPKFPKPQTLNIPKSQTPTKPAGRTRRSMIYLNKHAPQKLNLLDAAPNGESASAV